MGHLNSEFIGMSQVDKSNLECSHILNQVEFIISMTCKETMVMTFKQRFGLIYVLDNIRIPVVKFHLSYILLTARH